jgi:hypothetical protein
MSKPELPDSYVELVRVMLDAGRAWLLARPGLRLRLRTLDERAMYIGELNEPTICWYAEDEDSRAFLRELDRASDGQATLQQARMAIEIICGRVPPAKGN